MVQSLLSTLSGQGFGPGGGGGDGPGGPGGGGMDYGALHTLLNWENFNQFSDIRDGQTDSAAPQAYLNYMMFDEQLQLVPDQSGAVQVSPACADNWAVINTLNPINIRTNGYLLVYIDDIWKKNVYFDDIHVLHKKGRLLEENHYYPHGLTIRSGSTNPLPTREGYQGKELQNEAGLELYDFHARQYDPQIGRFWGIDPADQFPSGYTGMGNNPANLVDPNGAVTYGASELSSPGSRSDFENAESRKWGARENYWNSPFEEYSSYSWIKENGGSGSNGQGEEDIPEEGEKDKKGESSTSNPNSGESKQTANKQDSQQEYFPPPKTGLEGFPEAGKGAYNKESKRWRWKLPNGDILEWDKQHGEVERYDKTGKTHKGAFDPKDGSKRKPGKSERTTNKFESFRQEYDGPRYINPYYSTPPIINGNSVRNAIIVGGTAIIVTDIIMTYGPFLILL